MFGTTFRLTAEAFKLCSLQGVRYRVIFVVSDTRYLSASFARDTNTDTRYLVLWYRIPDTRHRYLELWYRILDTRYLSPKKHAIPDTRYPIPIPKFSENKNYFFNFILKSFKLSSYLFKEQVMQFGWVTR